jgi:hypothetical protein
MTPQAIMIEQLAATYIQLQANTTTAITEQMIESSISQTRTNWSAQFPTSDKEHAVIRARLLARYLVTMDIGVSVAVRHEPWYAEVRRSKRHNGVPEQYWERYCTFLRQRFGDAVIRSLDVATDGIVDFFGNPLTDGSYQRRGLILGDVQSGKTSTYIGLSCKASDAGYRLIILLTGTIEHLRRQTQRRLDTGFVGFETGNMRPQQGAEARQYCGVGLIDPKPIVQVLTTTDSDFTINFANQASIQLDGAAAPILLVTKKNKNNLENIIRWIRNSLPHGAKLNTPMLLIDDESDNASVNTAAGDDPNRINAQIRELLDLGHRATYVGVTATPFANVFIRHDTYHDMLKDDLFPRDFIYSLSPPTNYIGASRLFTPDPPTQSPCKHAIVTIDDAETWLPLNHKIASALGPIPPSLRSAICRFMIAVTVRDLRGTERESHRAMMVNVSRFTRIQNGVRDQIGEFVARLVADVREYAGDARKFDQLPTAVALRAAHAELETHCKAVNASDRFPSWDEVRSELTATLVTRGIVVNAVNSENAVEKLSFENGERRIVIGGNSLSRGITLDGLCVSYFHRKPLAKDTLLQMGRWFGYRDHFNDLCSIHISEDSCERFADAAETSDELRELVNIMNARKEIPAHFGLRILHHPGRLAITAQNKMRSSREFKAVVSFSGVLVETSLLRLDDVEDNLRHVRAFCEALQGEWNRDSASTAFVAMRVPKEGVADLIEKFRFPGEMIAFQTSGSEPSPAAKMIRAAAVRTPADGHGQVDMSCWDVAVVQGASDAEVSIAGLPERIKLRKRGCSLPTGSNALLVSKQKARLGDKGDEGIGVDATERARLRQSHGSKLSGQLYRDLRSRTIGRPLLIINFFKPEVMDAQGRTLPDIVVGLGLSFPYYDHLDTETVMHYRIGTVAQAVMDQHEDGDGADE